MARMGVAIHGVHGGGWGEDAGERGFEARRSRRGALLLCGSAVAVVLLVVARDARGELKRSGSAELEAKGTRASQIQSRYVAERTLTRLWDEDAVGTAMDAEIAAVKRQFKQEQLGAQTAFFGLRTTALQSGNATDNATDASNATAANMGIAFDNAWFNRWYDWYDSNYGSSYTARKEEHVARILGTRFENSAGQRGESETGDGGVQLTGRGVDDTHGQQEHSQEDQTRIAWKQVAVKQSKLHSVSSLSAAERNVESTLQSLPVTVPDRV